MRISVVIPCYNSAQWIQDALQSVADQTYKVHEIIVIDDGSKDDSIEQIEKCGLDIKLLRTSHLNAASARNIGVKEATGDWIAFLDADDIWYPHHLENAVSLLRQGNDIAYLCHNDQLRCDVNKEDEFINRKTFPPVDKPTGGLSDEIYFSWWVRRAWFCTCSLVVRRDAFLAVGGFDTTQKRRHDFEMFLRVIYGKTWAYNPTAGMAYRFQINPNCVSSNIVETSYYTLRGLIKNRGLYNTDTMAEAIKKWAVKTAQYIVLSLNKNGNQQAWKLCWPHLGPLQKLFFGLGRKSPRLVNTAKRLKKAFVP